MILNDKLLLNLFNKIDNNTQNAVFHDYTGLFVDDKNNHIPIINIVGLLKTSDYVNMFSDYLHISIHVQKSVYLHLLTVNRKKLRFHLIKKPVSSLGTDFNRTSSETLVYEAYLLDNKSLSLELPIIKSTYTEDLTGFVEIAVQLVESGLTEYRLYEIGGVYRNINVETLLQGIMSHPIKTLSSSKNTNKSYNVDVYPVDNKKKYYQILLSNGIRLPDLPAHVQSLWGVYESNLGVFLTKNMIYLYPLYDFTRYGKEKKYKLTIVKVPNYELSNLTKSYSVIGNEIFAFSTGDAFHEDNSDATLDKTGTGFRVGNIDNMMVGYAKSSNGKTIIAKGQNYVNVSYDDRKSNSGDNIKTNNEKLSGNYFKDASDVKKGFGNTVVFGIEAFQHDLCYPGMPIRYIYKHFDKVYSLFGVLQFIETEWKTYRQNSTDTRYVSVSKLIIFCERATQ